MSDGYDTPSAPRRTELDPSTDTGYTDDRIEYIDPIEPAYPDVPAAAGSSTAMGASSSTDWSTSSGTNSGTNSGTDSTAGVAANQAKQVGQDALDSGKQVAGVGPTRPRRWRRKRAPRRRTCSVRLRPS